MTSDENKRSSWRRLWNEWLRPEFEVSLLGAAALFFVYGGLLLWPLISLMDAWVPESAAWAVRMDWLGPLVLFVAAGMALVAAGATAKWLQRRWHARR